MEQAGDDLITDDDLNGTLAEVIGNLAQKVNLFTKKKKKKKCTDLPKFS